MAQRPDYYDRGSVEPAVASSLTVRKLEMRRELTRTNHRLIIVLVGLPGRGKSFIGRKLHAFLTWRGEACKVFNVGKYRRQAHRSELSKSGNEEDLQEPEAAQVDSPTNSGERKEAGSCDANFFDSNNREASKLREEVAKIALADMLRWLYEDITENNEGLASIREMRSEDSAECTKRKLKERFLSPRDRSRVAIFDATNSTKERRQMILETCKRYQQRAKQQPIGVVFVESICDDKELLEENFRYKIKTSPDFKGLTCNDALADLRERARNYEKRYETLDDDSQSYIKVFNFSSKLMANQIYGRMSKVIVPALMAWHIGDRPIFLCRAGKTFGEEELHYENTDGGAGLSASPNGGLDPNSKSSNSSLSSLASQKKFRTASVSLGSRGLSFRDALHEFVMREGLDFMKRHAHAFRSLRTGTSVTGTSTSLTGISAEAAQASEMKDIDEDSKEEKESNTVHMPLFPCFIMTSTMPRAIQSATWEQTPFDVNQYSNLNPLDKGDFSGMELSDIKENEPEWYAQLEEDPFRTRFPGGECYQDLVSRLETTIIDMEQQISPVVVVSHVSVIQCLLAYFRSSPVEKCTTIEVPMHTVIKITPLRGGGWNETHHKLLPFDCSDEVSSGSEGGGDTPPIWGDTVKTVNTDIW